MAKSLLHMSCFYSSTAIFCRKKSIITWVYSALIIIIWVRRDDLLHVLILYDFFIYNKEFEMWTWKSVYCLLKLAFNLIRWPRTSFRFIKGSIFRHTWLSHMDYGFHFKNKNFIDCKIWPWMNSTNQLRWLHPIAISPNSINISAAIMAQHDVIKGPPF